ncbi:hypothetical protein ACFQH5_20240 [Halomonas salifodinae]|uniref:Uncharacterized protein n=1 Tax=Halomonas salifodinae TaxID=438745 RepID=A0ABW2F4A0_9GAMM
MTLFDARGRKMRPATATAKAVVFVSEDGESWTPVMAYNVPESIKALDAMSWMLQGEILETAGGKLYRAESAQ